MPLPEHLVAAGTPWLGDGVLPSVPVFTWPSACVSLHIVPSLCVHLCPDFLFCL